MFIKIVRHAKENMPYREFVRECSSYNLMNNYSKVEECANVKTLVIDPHEKDPLVIDIDPAYEELFIMNNEGKTVDYYTWAREDQDQNL